jgi:hypothetical protein
MEVLDVRSFFEPILPAKHSQSKYFSRRAPPAVASIFGHEL